MATAATARKTSTPMKPDSAAAATRKAAQARKIKEAAETLKLGSDPTRLKILLILRGGDRYVGAMCEEMEMSQPTTSHHLAGLRAAGVIESRRDGKRVFYALSDKGRALAAAVDAVMG